MAEPKKKEDQPEIPESKPVKTGILRAEYMANSRLFASNRAIGVGFDKWVYRLKKNINILPENEWDKMFNEYLNAKPE